MPISLVIAPAIALVALNTYSTARVLRSSFFSGSQKAAQIVLTWVIPLFGALLVLRVMTDEPVVRNDHFEQIEHSDRTGLNGQPTPWSGSHEP